MHVPCPEWGICCTEGDMYKREYKLDFATSKSLGHNAHCQQLRILHDRGLQCWSTFKSGYFHVFN